MSFFENPTGVWFGSLVLVLITIVVVVLLWQGMKTGRSAMRGSYDDAYRKLAERSVETEERLAAVQEKTAATLEDLNVRVTALEKLLREVA